MVDFNLPPQQSNGLPPDIHATPSDLRAAPDEQITWWQPDWRERLSHLGWRWAAVIPALAVAALGLALLFYYPRGSLGFLGLEIKLLKLAAAICIPAVVYGIRKSAQSRLHPFCIHCGYNLTGLPDHHRCPECGRPYSWKVMAEYRRDPKGFRERWEAHKRLPPAQAAMAAGPVRRKRRARDGTE